MAETLASYDFAARSAAKYPWDEWTNGEIWQVKRGEDFQVKRDSFRSILKIQATRRKMKLQTSAKDADTLVFRFIKEGQ